jgi:RNA recognition motif-containing protein
MKVYFGNLPKQFNDAQLNELAAPFGALTSANVVTDRGSGESKGFGFVMFETPEGGQAAIAGLNGKDVNGQVLKVNEAKPPKDRTASATPAQS